MGQLQLGADHRSLTLTNRYRGSRLARSCRKMRKSRRAKTVGGIAMTQNKTAREESRAVCNR
jgi:hypothetical protein